MLSMSLTDYQCEVFLGRVMFYFILFYFIFVIMFGFVDLEVGMQGNSVFSNDIFARIKHVAF